MCAVFQKLRHDLMLLTCDVSNIHHLTCNKWYARLFRKGSRFQCSAQRERRASTSMLSIGSSIVDVLILYYQSCMLIMVVVLHTCMFVCLAPLTPYTDDLAHTHCNERGKLAISQHDRVELPT